MDKEWIKIVKRLDNDENLIPSITKKNLTYKSHFILLQFEELLSEIDSFYFNDIYLHDKSSNEIIVDFVRECWYQYIYLNYFIQKEMYEECRLVSDTIEMIKEFTSMNFNNTDKEGVLEMLNGFCDEIINDMNTVYNINFISVDK